MIGLVLSALWGRLRACIAFLGQFIFKCPLCAVCAALVILAGVQTWRLSTCKQSLQVARAQVVALRTASDQAAKAQAELRAKERQEYQERADHAETEYRAALADARTATAAFIARNRVRAASGGSGPVTIGSPDPAGQPADVPEAAIMVAESDVQSAGDWQAYGVACHNVLTAITEP